MIAIILENQTLSYGELLYFAQQLGSHLVINNGVGLGHVVCQLLERSIETVIGILAIWMIGGVYAPLNSRDPEARLKTCLAMTHTRCILAHFATRNIISDPCYLVVEIDQILYHSHSTNNELCSINVIPEHLSHIVFTSGSTGTPKAVQLRHRNFVSYIHSYIIQPNEITLHHTAVTFDAHLEEIVGPLIKGGQVIILPPDAHLDMNILSTTIMRHQVTYLGGVPTQLTLLEKFIKTCNSDCLMTLRTISSGGESLLTSTVQNLLPYLNTTCQFYNCYGPAECTEGAIQYLVRKDELIFNTVVPIGQPMLHVQVHLLDDYLQPTIPSIQIGEIFIGGAGVFAGYCNEFDDHDSAKVLFMFDKQIFYRTGDFAKLNVQSKLLEFKGRRDYQVKLRGQRIDLGEIESTILAATPFVQNCVVMKQEAQDAYDNDAFLVAYLTAHQNSVDDKDKLCEQIAFYCQQHLPTYMVPLRWSFLDSFPTNQNGKIDRKLLPYVKRTPYQKIVSQPTTSLERQLRQIFSKAFSIESDVIDVTLSFEQLGGTSLGIIRALSLIQHSVYKHMDIHLLLTNPSVRQLGMKIESLLYLHDNELHEMIEYDDSSLYLQPSLFIEAFAMLLLMILWIFPVWIAYTSMLPIVMIVLFIVSFHLFTYTILVHILKPFVKEQDQELFSFSYYAWWFLSRLWTLNSTFWLCSLVGTPFYNAYLRMCGAHIGNNVHIYTVLIDAPWLIDISEETFIGEEVYFNHISYQNKTFELRRILIGRSCFIGAYSVLYEGAAMRDGSFVESYSAVKGNFIGSDVQYTSCSYRPTWVLIFQFLSLLAVTTVYAMSLKIVFAIHVPMIPLLLSVPLRFLLWILLSATIALLALKFVAGKIEFGNYSFYSWSYLRCLWFRRLIISFFYYPLSQIVCGYQRFSLVILSWLGMDIRGTNIEIADVIPFLLYPSHLVSIDDDVTTFGGVHLLPFYINTNGQCVVDSIKLGRGVTLGNHCLIHPGVHLPSGTLVATLTRVTQNTECADGKVLLGLPARSMPFIQPSSISNSYSTTSRFTVFKAVVLEIIANTIPLLIVSSIQLESMKNYFFIILFMFVLIYSILVCGLNRYCVQTKPGAYSFEETTSNWCHVLIVKMTINWTNLLEPFLGGTQWLIFLARGLGVRIKGSDVILSSLSNVTDYHLITIGEHVRMHNRAILQCHTFEQRVYKLAPIIVGPRSIIKSTSFILPGAKLDGANVIEPLTLIMKEEHLREGIHYYGNPARTQPGNITY